MPNIGLTIKGKNLSRQALSSMRADLKATSAQLDKLENAFDDVGDKSQGARESLIGVGAAATIAGAALSLMIKGWIGATVQFQRMNMGLIAVAGSAAEAHKQMLGLRKVALLPGLGLPEAVKASVSLQAVGVSAGMAERALMAFGNAIATVGGGRMELAGVVLALTQMSAKGKVLGQDLRQMAERLPQIRKAMMDAFGTASGEALGKMGITTEKFLLGIVKEFEKLPSVAGGAFNAIENLTDATFNMKVALGSVLLPTVTKIIEQFAKLTSQVEELSSTTRSIIAWGAVVSATFAMATAAVVGFRLVQKQTLAAVSMLGKGLLWMVASPIGAAITAIALLSVGIAVLIKRQHDARMSADKLTASMEEMRKSADKLANMAKLAIRLDELRKKEKLTTEETKELAEVQKQLVALSPRLVDKYDSEGKAIVKQTAAITKLIEETKSLNKTQAKDIFNKALKEEARLIKQVKDEASDLAKIEKKITDAEKELAQGTKGLFRTENTVKLNKEFVEVMEKRAAATAKNLIANKAALGVQTQFIKQYRASIKFGFGGEVQGPPPLVKPPELTSKEKKERIEIAVRAAKMEANLIEDKYEKQRAMARAATVAETMELAERSKVLEKTVVDGLKTELEAANGRGVILQSLGMMLEELAQEIKEIDEAEAKDKIEKAKEVQQERETIAQKRLDLAREEAEAIKSIEADIAAAQISNARDVISMMENRFDRQRAEADLTFGVTARNLKLEASAIEKFLEETLERNTISAKERGALEDKLAQIRADKITNEMKWEDNKKRIVKARIEDERNIEEKNAAAIAQMKTSTWRMMTQAFLDEELQRKAAVVIGFAEEESRLKKIASDTKNSAEVRKQAETSLMVLQFAQRAELEKLSKEFMEKRLKDLESRTQKEERLAERAAKALSREEREAMAEWEDNQFLKVELMREGLEKELAYIRQAYVAESNAIVATLRLEEVSSERKAALEEKLGLLRQKLAKDYREATLNNQGLAQTLAQTLASQLAAMPGAMVSLYMRAGQLQDEYRDKLTDLLRSEQDRLNQLKWDTEKSAAERAQLVERIERQSAEKRYQIEKDLTDRKAQLFSDYVKSFIGGILKDLEAELQERISSRILEFIANQMGGATGGGSNISGIAQGIAGLNIGQPVAPQMDGGGAAGIGGLLSGIVGVLSGNPFAALQAIPFLLNAASFDDPFNDFRAKMAGMRQAANDLGSRSAGDVVNEFSKGFSQRSSEGGKSSEMTDILSAIRDSLDNPPEFNILVDGRTLDSVIQPVRKKREQRGNAY